MRPALAAAAAAGAVTTTAPPIYLTLQVGPSGTALTVSKTPSPFPNRTITMTQAEFRTFRLFMLHVLRLNSGTPDLGLGIGRISPIHDTTLDILYFLYADIARLIAPQLSPQEQLECTAVALCAAAPARYYSERPLFYLSFDLKVSSMLNAALNACLDELNIIINKTNQAERGKLLCEYRTATVNGIERFGTALQMALYSGDNAMAKAIRPHMDYEEFQRQWIEVFGKDYNAFLEGQKIQAVELCSELRTPFNSESVKRFQQTLTTYVRENPVHNPFILQTLFEIYGTLPSNSELPGQFSQLVIGHAEKLSSFAWLQHLAQGIYEIVEKNAPLSRSFLLQGTRRLDIRSLDGLGVNCCVDILGVDVLAAGVCEWRGKDDVRTSVTLQNFSQVKTLDLGKLIPPVSVSWCVIQ